MSRQCSRARHRLERSKVVSKARLASESDMPKGGRLRLHGPRKSAVAEGEAGRGLAEKQQRRTVHVNAVLASGAADFDAAPGREGYAEGEAGAQQHEQAFVEYVEGNFDDAGKNGRNLLKEEKKKGHAYKGRTCRVWQATTPCT